MNKYENYEHDLNTIEMTMKLQCNKEYEDIKDNFETIKELVEKEKPKKPLKYKLSNHLEIVCPNCECYVNTKKKYNYCKECGQKLDWNDENE